MIHIFKDIVFTDIPLKDLYTLLHSYKLKDHFKLNLKQANYLL